MENLTEETFLAGAKFRHNSDKSFEYQHENGLVSCERPLNKIFYSVSETNSLAGVLVKTYFFGQVHWFMFYFKDCTIIEDKE